MRKDIASTVFLALTLGALVFLSARQVFILEHLRMQGASMVAGELSSSWVSGGVVRTVTTTRNENETVAAWQQRHFDAVKARMDQYPPD